MSGVEQRAYAMSPGAVAAGHADDSDLPAQAVRILDQRDSSHLVQFGHLPGAAGCSLAGRGEAVTAAMAAARGGDPSVRWVGTTQEIVDELNRRGPWLNASVGAPDPEVSAARERLAVKLAGLADPGQPPPPGWALWAE